jgi:hypothetical protein
MDSFSLDILSQQSGSRVAPETLEMLGRKASQMLQQNGVPLNQAIKELASQHPELGNEHLKRVVEFANNVTFQEMFQNGQDKNVHFEVADPGVILRDLKDGGSPAHDGQTLRGGSDYMNAPKQQDNGMADQIWPSGGGDGSIKMASTPVLTADEAYDHQQQVQGLVNKLAESYELAEGALTDAKERLYDAVKQEVIQPDGAGLGGVMGALTKLASEEMVGAVLPGMVERLREEGFQPNQLEKSLEKRAGAFVNHQHPLATSFQDVLKIANELVTTGAALSQAESELSQAKAEFKKLAGPLTSAVRDAIDHTGKLPAAIRQRFPRT